MTCDAPINRLMLHRCLPGRPSSFTVHAGASNFTSCSSVFLACFLFIASLCAVQFRKMNDAFGDVVILDAGSQYGKRIDRRVRELNVKSDLRPLSAKAEYLKEAKYK